MHVVCELVCDYACVCICIKQRLYARVIKIESVYVCKIFRSIKIEIVTQTAFERVTEIVQR